MNGRHDLSDEFWDLVDAYCDGSIEDDGLHRLESYLLADADARREFVAYFHQHTELQFLIRARRSAEEVLGRIDAGARPPARPPRRGLLGMGRLPRRWALAGGVLLAVLGLAAILRGWLPAWGPGRGAESTATPAANVAWLVNAQDCQWEGDGSGMPGRDMRAGKVLRLRRGLAEIEFDSGARVILQGPADLELLSGNGARLLFGSLTARVSHAAQGFLVLSPRGRVVDLGTEFGLAVDEHGDASVHVFRGAVLAAPLSTEAPEVAGVTLPVDQGARIDGRTVTLIPAGADDRSGRFVRAIVPPPVIVPRTRTLGFSRPVPGTLQDRDGEGVGLTHRLPGTGGSLPGRDGNLRLDPRRGVLALTTTRSDIHRQEGMPTGEYLGLRLAELGFTGREDFAITVVIPRIPSLESLGQFGLYAGTRSDRNIRGGLLNQVKPDTYGLFLVNNNGGFDSYLNLVALKGTGGDDLRMTLQRIAGKYSLVVENRTKQTTNTLAIAHPAFLNGERDLHVGLFGANAGSDVRRTLTIDELSVTVWTVSPAEGPAARDADLFLVPSP